MGNYSLKDCSLKPGYVPVGVASYGDIIYITSYCINENENGKHDCEIGTYPSPKYPYNQSLEIKNQAYAEDLKLENNYKPLWNFGSDSLNREDFNTDALNFDLEHPVNIEIQPSYDGSVNLILNDDKNEPRIINSGFSIYENRKVRLVKRDQTEETNFYIPNKFYTQTRLKKVVNKIPRFELVDVLSTGQLKGGNYTFYLKMADGDFNKSDIVAESGQVSIFKGNPDSINSISGTLLNETTDKAIQLKIRNIDESYSNFYILYSREYSDLQGIRMYDCRELTKPFSITDKNLKLEEDGTYSFSLQIDGTEEEQQISEEELNIEYIPINTAKTQAQQQNMLFLGNISSSTSDYKALQEIAYKVKVTLKQSDNSVGWVKADYKTENKGSEYYDPKNIYSFLGYWPEEFYRFGIVFIRDDDTVTPAFNIIGKSFKNIDDSTDPNIDIEWDNFANENYIVKDKEFYNKNGVFKNPKPEGNKVQNYDSQEVYPWYYEFELDANDALSKLGIKGYFYVRQKRVPTILCQGMAISIDKTGHTPMLFDSDWGTYKTQADIGNNCPDRLVNGEQFFMEDKVDGGDNTIPAKYASKLDAYFTESFLATFDDRCLFSDPFQNKSSNAQYHEYLVTDGKSPVRDEKNDKNYTALGDHIIRTDVGHKQCSALLSLDPCVIPELKTRLNGEDRYLTPQVTLNFTPVFTTSNASETETPPSEYSRDATYNLYKQLTASYKGFVSEIQDMNTKLSTNFEPPFKEVQKVAGPTASDEDVPESFGIWYNIYEFDDTLWNEIVTGIFFLKEQQPNNTDVIKYFERIKQNPDVIYKTTYNKLLSYLKIWQVNKASKQSASSGADNIVVPGNARCYNTAYYTRAFRYDTKKSDPTDKGQTNKVIFVNSGTASKSIPHPEDQEKSLVYCTQAGDPNDVSKVALFGEGDEYRDKKYGAQFKWCLRGVYTPLLGVNDVNSTANPFLKDNTIYNIYTDNYTGSVKDIENWFTARSIDNAPFYAVSDRYSVSNTVTDIFRGDCFTNTVTFRINRNFVDPEVPIVNEVLKFNSWGEKAVDGFYATPVENWKDINRADVNAVSLGMWVTFKVMSNYNLGIRSEDTQHTDEQALMGNPRSFFPKMGISADCGQKIEDSWLLNSGYNATLGRKSNLINKQQPYYKTDYSNRIMFSNIGVKDSFSNGYRVFQGASYRDIDNQYGEIVKLIPWGNNLFCVFEHGCAIVPINEKALMQTTAEQTIHIYGYGVLPDQLSIVSQDFGSIWADSVIRTPLGIYGIDSSAKKIWRYTDSKGFETISDMVIQRFLNDNLLVEEGDKYTNVLNMNIKTHYNAYKGDVLFTFYKNENSWNICYNERQGIWVTRYSWMPISSENINNQFYTFGLEQAKAGESKLYLHGRTGTFDEISYVDDNPTNQLKPTKWYDKQEPFEFEFVVREDVGMHKLFDNLIIVSNNVQPTEIQFSLIGDTYLFNKSRLYHEAEGSLNLNIYKNTDDGFNKTNLRGTIANPYKPLESKYLKNTKIQYDPILDQYELVMSQPTKNMETFGRRLGNIHYKEDAWYFVFDPIIFDENINSQTVEQTSPKWKQVPLRDKWLKVRIKYKGDQLAIITALNTIYRLTSS